MVVGNLQAVLNEPLEPEMFAMLLFFGFLAHVFGSVVFRGFAQVYE